MKNQALRRYSGDRSFNRMLLALILPMIVQQGVTNFVNLLDNIMVGSLGTLQMSGVAIMNQLMFVYMLSLFGGLSGVSIFGAQFYGMGDHNGMRHTVRIKLYFGAVFTVLALVLFEQWVVTLAGLFFDRRGYEATDLAAPMG